MAVQPFTILHEEPGLRMVRWVLGNGDSGKPVPGWMHSDRTIQVYGTFGTGGTVIPEGSNDVVEAGANYFQLRSPDGLAISFGAAGGKQILEHSYLIRPRCTAGDGSTALTVTMCLASTKGR